MCICNPTLRTPFCNKGFCVSPREFQLKEFKTSEIFERRKEWPDRYIKNDVVNLKILDIHKHVVNRKTYIYVEFPNEIYCWVEDNSIDIYNGNNKSTEWGNKLRDDLIKKKDDRIKELELIIEQFKSILKKEM